MHVRITETNISVLPAPAVHCFVAHKSRIFVKEMQQIKNDY
jgi:hypothetical protein